MGSVVLGIRDALREERLPFQSSEKSGGDTGSQQKAARNSISLNAS